MKASGSSFGLGARRKKESKSQKQSEHTQGERFDGQLFEPPSLKMRQISLQNPMTDYFTRLDGKKAKKYKGLEAERIILPNLYLWFSGSGVQVGLFYSFASLGREKNLASKRPNE